MKNLLKIGSIIEYSVNDAPVDVGIVINQTAINNEFAVWRVWFAAGEKFHYINETWFYERYRLIQK